MVRHDSISLNRCSMFSWPRFDDPTPAQRQPGGHARKEPPIRRSRLYGLDLHEVTNHANHSLQLGRVVMDPDRMRASQSESGDGALLLLRTVDDATDLSDFDL